MVISRRSVCIKDFEKAQRLYAQRLGRLTFPASFIETYVAETLGSLNWLKQYMFRC